MQQILKSIWNWAERAVTRTVGCIGQGMLSVLVLGGLVILFIVIPFCLITAPEKAFYRSMDFPRPQGTEEWIAANTAGGITLIIGLGIASIVVTLVAFVAVLVTTPITRRTEVLRARLDLQRGCGEGRGTSGRIDDWKDIVKGSLGCIASIAMPLLLLFVISGGPMWLFFRATGLQVPADPVEWGVASAAVPVGAMAAIAVFAILMLPLVAAGEYAILAWRLSRTSRGTVGAEDERPDQLTLIEYEETPPSERPRRD